MGAVLLQVALAVVAQVLQLLLVLVLLLGLVVAQLLVAVGSLVHQGSRFLG